MNHAPQIAFFISCLGLGWSGQLELKYNLVGALVPEYSEHALEIEYARNDFLIPFVRFAYLDRIYKHESWAGDEVGRSTENGYEAWVGGKIKPFPRLRGLELAVSYRRAELELVNDYYGFAYTTGKDAVTADAIGVGLGYGIEIGERLVIEPFWYGDYGWYDIRSLSGTTEPISPYMNGWDDQHRVGLNVGIRLGKP